MTGFDLYAKIRATSWKKVLFFRRKIMANPVRSKITMACTECKERNYATTKNKKTQTERIEMNKFCSRCGKHTLHKETK